MPDRYESKIKELMDKGMSYQEAQQSKSVQAEEPAEVAELKSEPDLFRAKTDKKGK